MNVYSFFIVDGKVFLRSIFAFNFSALDMWRVASACHFEFCFGGNVYFFFITHTHSDSLIHSEFKYAYLSVYVWNINNVPLENIPGKLTAWKLSYYESFFALLALWNMSEHFRFQSITPRTQPLSAETPPKGGKTIRHCLLYFIYIHTYVVWRIFRCFSFAFQCENVWKCVKQTLSQMKLLHFDI